MANRVYLYLVHFHSGRIEWKERKKLVKVFNSSHTAIGNAIANLSERNLVKVKKGWIQAFGQRKINRKTYNFRFRFTLDELFNRQLFTNKLFTCIYQTSAMLYGKKEVKDQILFPQPNLYSDSVTLQGGSDSNECLKTSSSVNIEFMQKQSSSYLAKLTDRHEFTTYQRLKKIKKQNLFSKNPEVYYEKNGVTVETEDGFDTKHFSPVVGFDSFEDALTSLKVKKTNDLETYKTCFVKRSRNGGYAIVKPIPTSYFYSVKFKKIFNGLKEDFSLQISP